MRAKHPFYIKEWSDDGKRPKPVGHEDLNEHWVGAGHLKVGDKIEQADGTTGVVANVVTLQQTREMFNLTVSEAHTYYVGQDGWLVHNQSINQFDLVPYRPSNSAFGLENHHGIMDAWAKYNVPGYKTRAGGAPTIALTPTQHNATKQEALKWLEEQTGTRDWRKLDWTKVSPLEAQKLSERMFDKAGVPDSARAAYYNAFEQYKNTGKWVKPCP